MTLNHLITVIVSLFISVILSAQIDTAKIDSTELNTKLEPQSFTTLEQLDEESDNQDISGILQSSSDVFTAVAGFNFGAARYRIRGYDSEHFTALVNGMVLNNPENGRAVWAYWGGLNDITRYQETRSGIAQSDYIFSGIGGFSNISTRASSVRKGNRISYASANQTYDHRLMFTTSTGMMQNNLAFVFSGSLRYANEGYVEGTYYSSASYLVGIEKKLNDKNSIALTAFGSPTVSGGQSISVNETYLLTENFQYNSFWGFQAGEKRNSRIRNTHKPYFLLNHYFKPNEKTNITNAVFYTIGRNGQTRLNWYDAADPRPDYYRNLPSYYNIPGYESKFNELTLAWQNDVNTQQLDFDQMYFSNSKNLFTQNNADGIDGNSVTGNRAKYILEELRNDQTQIGATSTIKHILSEKIILTGGLNASFYKSKNFKVLNDLLGADFWVDVDRFAERDFVDNNAAQSNLETPNRIVKQGDTFGYNYVISVNNIFGFMQTNIKLNRIEIYSSITAASSSFFRNGKYLNGLFPDNSFGNSEVKSFFTYGIKSGLIYKITGRHLITFNAAYLTKPPLAQNAFISPRTRNEIVSNLKAEQILSGDVNYIVRYARLKLRATGFYTSIKNKTWTRNFFHDDYNTLVNYVMTGIDQLHMGTEFGADIKLTSTIDITPVFTIGNFIYNSRPSVTISQDNSTNLLAENRTVYLKNYKMGGMPQSAASLGIKYNATKFWFAGANINYFADTYIEVNPDRRTEEALLGLVDADPQVDAILKQTRLENNYTINVFGGKSWRIKHKYFLRLNLNINNALNKKDIAIGGFEQLRYEKLNIEKFPPKISYMYGRTYFAMLSFSF